VTKEVADCAKANAIVLFALPLHLTHILQPLDVGCFQPLKWYHGQELDYASRTGASDISKADVLSTLENIRKLIFSTKTIRSGWRRTGRHPHNRELVLAPLTVDETAPELAAEVLPERDDDDDDGAALHQPIYDADSPNKVHHRPHTPPARTTTPELVSSDVETGSTLSKPSTVKTYNSVKLDLKQAKLVRCNYNKRSYEMPNAEALPEAGWWAPESVQQIELQQGPVANALFEYLPSNVRVGVMTHLSGIKSLARNAKGFRRQSLSTKAAKAARDERREHKRKKLDVGDGPIYAEDCRAMVKKRVEDEITATEQLLKHKQHREIKVKVNKLLKLHPTVRGAA
jgi:hypothetical protein